MDTPVPTSSLFQQPWWLDATAPGAWEEAGVERGGELVARLPYTLDRKYGLRVLGQPPLTLFLGPWLADPGDVKHSTRLAREKELLGELVEQLPRHDVFVQTCHYGFTNWLPLHWRGFTQTTRYSYVVEELGDLDAVWAGLEGSARRNIRKTEKSLEVRPDLGTGELLRLAALTYRRQGRSSPYDRRMLERLESAARERGQGRSLFAVDARDRVHAALFMVWDERSAYYLVGGVDDSEGMSGAMSLLIWHAIRHAAKVTRRFDFEGSIVEPIERFFRKFGPAQRPYFQLMHLSRRADVLLSARRLAMSLFGSRNRRGARLLPMD